VVLAGIEPVSSVSSGGGVGLEWGGVYCVLVQRKCVERGGMGRCLDGGVQVSSRGEYRFVYVLKGGE
jgi:hypothetical protein